MAEHKWLFAFTTFLSLLFFAGALIFILYLLSFTNTINYVLISVVSLIFGLVSGIILNKTTESPKKLIIGGLIVSIISAAIIFFLSSILVLLQSTMQKLADVQEGLVGGLAVDFFGTPGNPIISTILIFIFFNILFIINYLRNNRPNIEYKNLLLYFYGAIILAALCFILNIILNKLALGV